MNKIINPEDWKCVLGKDIVHYYCGFLFSCEICGKEEGYKNRKLIEFTPGRYECELCNNLMKKLSGLDKQKINRVI